MAKTLSQIWAKSNPSDYLRASDHPDDWHRAVTIDDIKQEELDGSPKVVLIFEELDQKLVLNKTAKTWLTVNIGDEIDDILGSRIELFRTMVDFKGDSVPAIRLRKVSKKRRRRRVDDVDDQEMNEDRNDSDSDDPTPF